MSSTFRAPKADCRSARKLNNVGGYQRRGSEKHSYAEDVPHSPLEFVLRLLHFRVTVAVSHLKNPIFRTLVVEAT